MNRKFFKNLIPEINTTVKLKDLELTIPDGFNQTLNSIEELLGLIKMRSLLKKKYQISKRLRYYLKLFNLQN